MVIELSGTNFKKTPRSVFLKNNYDSFAVLYGDFLCATISPSATILPTTGDGDDGDYGTKGQSPLRLGLEQN